MLSRSRCWGLSIIFFGAVALRVFALRWMPLEADLPPWPQWIVGLTAGSLLPSAVALLSWSRLPDRPHWGWCAAVAAAAFPSAVWAGAAGSPVLAISLIITLSMIDFDVLIGPRIQTPQRESSLWPIPLLGLVAIVSAWLLMRGDTFSTAPSHADAIAASHASMHFANILHLNPKTDSNWSRIESIGAIALGIASLMGAAIWLPHRLSLWPLVLPPIIVGFMLVVGDAEPPWRLVADPLLIVLAAGALTPLVGRPATSEPSRESRTSPRDAMLSVDPASIVAYPLHRAAAGQSQRRAG